MTTTDPNGLPPFARLRARLQAAGVTDSASLTDALKRDTQSWRTVMTAFLETFRELEDDEQIVAFWRSLPVGVEQPLIQGAEVQLRSASPDADPLIIQDMRARLEVFKGISRAALAAQEMSPVERAIIKYINAQDAAAARTVFERSRTLLQPYEALLFLEALAKRATNADSKQRLATRAIFLRELRGASQPPPIPRSPITGQSLAPPRQEAPRQSIFDNQQMEVGGSLYQAHTIHVTNVFQLARNWTRPMPPALTKALVARDAEMNDLIAALRAQSVVAINSITSPNAATLQGMAGVGKTALARLLARKTEGDYPDGVLWTDVGPTVQTRDDAQALLNAWAAHFVGGIGDKALSFAPEAVRALMNEHPRMLVILDNVWSLEGVKALREALPGQTRLVITTRSREIMRHVGGVTFTVGLLADADALKLLELRLGWMPVTVADRAWVSDLINRLGHHPLALDIAFGLLVHEGLSVTDWSITAARVVRQVLRGDAFETLKLPEDIDADANVAAALWVSYEALTEVARERFRALGAFAPDADFTTALAAAVWGCDESEARRELVSLTQRALMDERDGGLWRQHSVVRGYALALARSAGEDDAAANRHAIACDEAMLSAFLGQRDFEMWPIYSQIAHAVNWAIDNDLGLVLKLVGDCTNLQSLFGKIADNLSWSRRTLVAARSRGSPDFLARAYGTLANALGYAESLLSGNRSSLLHEALEAYDRILDYFRSDTAPLDYAGTQNNRAHLLVMIAGLPGEDRRARLYQALEANDCALEFTPPDASTLEFAKKLNSRALLMNEMATLPGESRRARLFEALTACDQAISLRPPDTVPLDYAMTQNTRGILLRKIAGLEGENRRLRLLEALDAHDRTLAHYRADTAPMAYAMTQKCRADLICEMAYLDGENRGVQLLQALEVYERVLDHVRPDTSPLDYAMTQGNMVKVFTGLAQLPGEDRLGWLKKACRAGWEALQGFRRSGHAEYEAHATREMQLLTEDCGADFLALWTELGLGEVPEWILKGAPEIDESMGLVRAFTQVENSDQMSEFVRSLSRENGGMLIRVVQQRMAREARAGHSDTVEYFRSRLEGLKQSRAATDMETLDEKAKELRDAADQAELDPATWRGVPELGDAVLAAMTNLADNADARELSETIRRAMASAYNGIGNVLSATNKTESLLAYDQAIFLRPDVAIWHRNRANRLIELGRLAEATVAISRARDLEPDAPQLTALSAVLRQARETGATR